MIAWRPGTSTARSGHDDDRHRRLRRRWRLPPRWRRDGHPPVITPLLDLQGVSRVYDTGRIAVTALQDVNLMVAHGEFVAIVGPSGSGKSTLMNILGCLDRPTTGVYRLEGHPVEELVRRPAGGGPQPGHRLRLPVLQPAAAHERAGERRHAPALPGRRTARPAGARAAAGPGAAGPGRSRRPRAERAVGRPAAAGGHRPRPGHPARASCWPTSRPATSTAPPARR